MKTPLVTLLLYEHGRVCWTNIGHRYYRSYNIQDQFWAHEGVRLKCVQVTFEDALKIILEKPGNSKSERNAIWFITAPECPDKEKYDFKDWSGYVYIDLDLDKSPRINGMSASLKNIFFKQLDRALCEVCPHNFKYIEHSSSGTGIHCVFYFECERNEKTYRKYTRWLYEVFRNKIDDYIKDFSHIFIEPECKNDNGKSKVFDEVYKRPFQKLYITGKDYILHECDGDCDGIEVSEEPQNTYKPEKETGEGKYNITYTSKKKWDLDHNDRFYVLTALKRYCDRKTAYKLWYDFCNDISLYKSYTTKKFIDMFDLYWDQKLDPSKGHIATLKKYGFNIDESEIHYYLNENEWLEKVFPDIVENCEYGINMAVAGTGVGKNQSLINMNDKMMEPLERDNHKPWLVIEPLNSIIESKYDVNKFKIVTGSKKMGRIDTYEMIITNYNHLVKKTIDGEYELIDNIEEWFSKFELIVIDESHIMLKDVFRSDVLVQFIKTLGEVKNVKILIMTATPMFEKSVLDIKKTFIVHKKERSTKKVIFREWTESEDKKKSILDLTCLADYYINNGMKVYIYWANGSSQQMKMFKENYHDPEKVSIYHKRLSGEDDMTQINENHILGNKDILISSCYFGVGNDLNDEIDNAAVIIVGMNPWQEDLQAVGRWRNAKHVECCIIVDDRDMERLNKTTAWTFKELVRKSEYELERKWNDKMIRDKSITIRRVTFMIHSKSDIFYLSRMNAAYEYSDQFTVKCEEFERRGYDVRRDIKLLRTNADYTEQLKEWRRMRKKIHNEQICNMVNNDIFDWEELRKDTKMERVGKIIKRLKVKGLLSLANVSSVSSVLRYETYLRFFGVNDKEYYDYAELFSILWTRGALINSTGNKKLNDGTTITMDDYYTICGYLIWLSFRNRDDNDAMTLWNYFSTFKKEVKDFECVSDEMVSKLFGNQYNNAKFNEESLKFYNTFFDGAWEPTIDDKKIMPKKRILEGNIVDFIKKTNIEEKDYSDIFWKLVRFCDEKKKMKEFTKMGGKMGSPKKKVKDLKTGKIYESKEECAKDIGKSNSYVTKYNTRFIQV